MAAIALALGSALCWGTADFFGGLRARALPLLAVMLISELAGLVLVVAWVGLGAITPPDLVRLAPALIAGLTSWLALAAFYRALAIGMMSIVAPISATAAIVPVIAGLAGGDDPSIVQFAGMAAAVVGVVLVAREEGDSTGDSRRSVLLAIAAAAGFGLYLWLMKPAAAASVPWALLVARIGAVGAIAVAAAVARVDLRPALAGRQPAVLALLGALDVIANGLYALATTKGLLAVVSVLGDLYPVATIVLAHALLGERVARGQRAGIAVVLGGVVMIAAG